MIIKRPADVRPSEITPEGVYRTRREFLAGLAGTGLLAAAPDVLAQALASMFNILRWARIFRR